MINKMPRKSKGNNVRSQQGGDIDSDFYSTQQTEEMNQVSDEEIVQFFFSNEAQYNRQNGEMQNKENRPQLCSLCLQLASHQCARCGDYYCSRKCQKSDWRDHRPICFPMPRLIRIGSNGEDDNTLPKIINRNDQLEKSGQRSEITKDIAISRTSSIKSEEDEKTLNGNVLQLTPVIPLTTSFPTNESCVVLLCFRSYNRCYVLSSNPSDCETRISCFKKIDQYGKTAAHLKEPKVNDYALTTRLRLFHRVQIVGYNQYERRYRVHFIDYGYLETRNSKDLFEINDEIISMPCYAKQVQLWNVKRLMGFENLSKRLTQYDNKEFKIVYIKDRGEIPLVKLFYWQTDKLLNEDIAKLLKNDNNKSKEINKSDENDAEKQKKCKQEETTNIAQIVSDDVNKKSDNLKNERNPKDDIKSVKTVENLSSNVTNTNGNAIETEEKAKDVLMTVIGESKNEDEHNKNAANNLPSKGAIQKKVMAPNFILKSIETHCMRPPFKMNKMSKDAKDFNVFVLDTGTIRFGYIGCIPHEHLITLKELQKYLTEEYKDDKQPYEPKIDEYCLAKYLDDAWYRAKVIDHYDDEYTVYYIDFTNELRVPSKEIRRYPKDLTIDCNTNLCLISDLVDDRVGELDEEQTAFLKKELHFKKILKVNCVKDIEGDLVTIKCDDVLMLLEENDLS
uniref:MYND-type domain-containing protein n=1 Tax=Glossina brevipalpis TaxID=37001 RepID=A0A1A9WB66_9MUSC